MWMKITEFLLSPNCPQNDESHVGCITSIIVVSMLHALRCCRSIADDARRRVHRGTSLTRTTAASPEMAALIVLALGLAHEAAAATPAPRPHIIFVMIVRCRLGPARG
jgi:hypothetical protein